MGGVCGKHRIVQVRLLSLWDSDEGSTDPRQAGGTTDEVHLHSVSPLRRWSSLSITSFRDPLAST